jgi:hypothetical protein
VVSEFYSSKEWVPQRGEKRLLVEDSSVGYQTRRKTVESEISQRSEGEQIMSSSEVKGHDIQGIPDHSMEVFL